MRKTAFIFAALAASALTAATTDRLWFSRGTVSLGLDASNLVSLSLEEANSVLRVATTDSVYLFDRSSMGAITVSTADATEEVLINYDGNVATVVNPYAFQGVDITVSGADVTVNNTLEKEIVYHLTGSTTTGSFKAYSTYKLEVMLDNVSITNDNGSAINIQTSKKTTVRVKDGSVSSLCDSKKYATPDGEDEKATLFSEGQIEFRGKGTLNITGTKKHAICSDDYVELKNTTINVLSAASDGIHANDYVSILSGTLKMTNLSGDGIDCDDLGYLDISGGTIDITVSADSNKGLKASGGKINVTGGNITITTTGNSVIKDNDPSYCSAIKCGSDFTMTAGTITITSSGKAGKGISVDGDAYFNGGTVAIEVAGAGGTYTTTSNTTDSYSSTCITVDGNMTILDGTYTLNTTSAATGGKCIKVDKDLTIGDATHSPTITATTRGAQFAVTSSSSGSGGGGFRPGGNFGGGANNTTSDYCNPKVIKAVGNLTVNNGTLTLSSTTTTEGGEGLESKAILTINGGSLNITSADDCINAATSIVITGGNIYCNSSGNDAIDSNGTIKISGGLIIALGATSPECGIDCDNNSNFTLAGGTLISLAGSNNTPSGSGTTQRVVTTTGSFNTTTAYTLTDASGNFLLSFTSPRAYTGNANLMISTPYMTTTRLSVKLYTGGTITGGTTFHGATTGATAFSGGTLKSTLTTK